MSRLLHVRLDSDAEAALEAILEEDVATASDAVRMSLVALARSIRRRRLREEAAVLMADQGDREIVADTREFFGDLLDTEA